MNGIPQKKSCIFSSEFKVMCHRANILQTFTNGLIKTNKFWVMFSDMIKENCM